MMSLETSQAIEIIEEGFLFDVTKATVALFYLLQGMEMASILYLKGREEQWSKQMSIAGPLLAHLKTFPAVSTTGPDMLGPGGEAVQLAFKAWVADIYGKWEKSRSETRKLLGDEGIRPEVNCMGDFRHIRHDLVHSGFATKEHSGKCRVLKWFKPGEQMFLMTDHVLDFLNQMGFFKLPTFLNDPAAGQIVSWRLRPNAIKPASLESAQFRLISARMDVDTDGEEGSKRYMISCVFSDGVFGEGPVEVPVEPELYLEGYVDEDGNVAFPGGQVISAGKLYEACYDYLEGKRGTGPGISGPDVKYIKDSGNHVNE